MTAACDAYHEYVFQIDNETGLPRSMTVCILPRYVRGVGWRPRECYDRSVFLEYHNDLAWKIPSRVRREILWGKKWVKSEYAVTAWVNPELRPEFFDILLTWEMTADSWKRFTDREVR